MRVRARASLAEYEAATDAAVQEARRLLDIFSALLRIAQVEGGSPRAGFAEVDLSALTETVANAYQPDAEEAGYRLASVVEAGVTVRGDKELLTQALANLVENAFRHTPPGTHVVIRLEAGRQPGPVLAVEDDGPGVGGADLARLVGRFYRAEAEPDDARKRLGPQLGQRCRGTPWRPPRAAGDAGFPRQDRVPGPWTGGPSRAMTFSRLGRC